VWFGANHHLNFKQVIDDVYPHETPDINVAEMMAVYKAISIVKNNGGLSVVVHTDSERTIDDINLILQNQQKGKKRKIYNKCPDIVDEIVGFYKLMNIRLVKVDSHQPNGDCPGNDGADELCDEALREIGCGKKTSSSKQAMNIEQTEQKN
jgi:ribonuclease HI